MVPWLEETSSNMKHNNEQDEASVMIMLRRRHLAEIEVSNSTEDFIDKVKEEADAAKQEVEDILNTNPNEWSTGQTIGVAVAGAVVLVLVILMLWCCCKRRPSKYHLDGSKQPHVVRFPAKGKVDARTHLPLGAKLHGAQKLHTAGLKGKGVRVAVIDSGIDQNHAGFHGKVVKQRWYRHGTPLSEDDHGTHVAGTIHFMAPEAQLYDYRVFGASGDLDGDEAIAKSIRTAVDEDGCHVINMSLRVSYPIVPAVQKAVQYAHSKGVYMVCAAGNSGDGDPLTNEMFAYPARWKETMSIAAVQKANGLPTASFSESNPQVDFAGVGVNVTSLKPGGGYQTMQGTSMAAPHVTGLIAALLTNGGDYSKNSMKNILTKSYAVDIGPKGHDNSTGAGLATFLSKSELDTLWESVSEGGNSNNAGQYHQAQAY